MPESSKIELPPIPKDVQGEQSWQDAVIQSGFVRRGYIEEVPGLNPEVRFVYSPMLPETASELSDRMAMAKSAAAGKAVLGRELSRRIKSWSLEEQINERTMRSLEFAIQNRLRLIVTGTGQTDIDPLWDEGPSEDDYEPIEDQVGN